MKLGMIQPVNVPRTVMLSRLKKFSSWFVLIPRASKYLDQTGSLERAGRSDQSPLITNMSTK
jgi:hypothetical protein